MRTKQRRVGPFDHVVPSGLWILGCCEDHGLTPNGYVISSLRDFEPKRSGSHVE